MAIESFLVVLREGASSQATDSVSAAISDAGGRIQLTAAQGRVIITTFEGSVADAIRKLPHVKLVGGVRIDARRAIRKIVVRQ